MCPVPTENDVAPEKEKSPHPPSASEGDLSQEVPTPTAACTDIDIGIPLYTEQQASLEYGAETKSSPCAEGVNTTAGNNIDGPEESTNQDVCKLEITSPH